MPKCRKCGRVAATIEMRRSPTPGLWLCKDKIVCLKRAAVKSV